MTKEGDERAWLSGRLMCATWDAVELEAKKDELLAKDLLKLRLTL